MKLFGESLRSISAVFFRSNWRQAPINRYEPHIPKAGKFMRNPVPLFIFVAEMLIGLSVMASNANAQTFPPTVSSNTQLRALSTVTYSSAIRIGYTTAGDSDQLTFFASNTPCSLTRALEMVVRKFRMSPAGHMSAAGSRIFRLREPISGIGGR